MKARSTAPPPIRPVSTPVSPTQPQSKSELRIAAAKATRDAFDAFAGPLDAHCVHCGEPSVFRSPPGEDPVWPDPSNKCILNKHFLCARDSRHRLYFVFFQTGFTIMKIGQLPSLADLGGGTLDKYRKALGKDAFAELHRAVGLGAHGVGVGSFVYLRRMFESLLEDAHKAAQGQAGWDEAAYQRQRVDERILSLRGHLPDFLVENRALYGILSKGIHELTEDECLGHFLVVRAGIELILDDVLARLEREQKTQEARPAIARLAGELKQAEPSDSKD